MPLFRRRVSEPKEPTVLRVGLRNPVLHTDPRDTQDAVSVLALLQIFETPYEYSEEGHTVEPVLFAGPLRDEAPRAGRQVCSAEVRPGIEFSDGTALTARHVADSLAKCEAFLEQAAVTAEGERLMFVLRRPNARFDWFLAQSFCSIVLEKGGERLGTGAYVVAPGSTAEAMRLVRNPRHRREVAIDEIHFRYFESASALVGALEAGEVDFTDALSRDDVARVDGVRKWFKPGKSTAALYFNTEKPHLRHPDARRALAMAVDRSELTRICYENALAFTASSILPPMMGSFNDGIRHSPSQARDLLAATGERLPTSLSLLLPWGPRPYLPRPQEVAETLTRQLQEVGVRLERRATRDSKDFYETVARGDFDLTLIGWIADSPDPADFLEANLSSKNIPELGKSPAIRANMGRLADHEIDAALEQFRRDPSDANLQRVLERVASQVPLLPLMYGPTIAVHSLRVKGFTPSAISFPDFAAMDLGE